MSSVGLSKETQNDRKCVQFYNLCVCVCVCGHIFLYINDSNSRLQLLKVSDKTQIMFLVVSVYKI